jgi:DNA-directed RNA polymerase subunit alpha
MDTPLNIKCVTTTTDSDGSIYGKFVIEPLERGYGTTLGNSLRRVLLSGLPGSAITSIRIEGANHEFSTLPGLKEDILDILLNVKGVVVKSLTDEPQALRLDADKAGPVYASDIQCPPDVKIINPDRLLCTLSEGGSFHADFTVENGKGYVPAAATRNTPIDEIPLDAVFMPIRRVSYLVEDTRVGQKTDYDKLTVEIWSNGGIEVADALSQASNILIEHFLPLASLAGTPTLLPTQAVQEEKTEKVDAPSITIEDLELSVRAFNCLKRANIHNMTELLAKTEHDLLNIKNFGKKSADEVIERLRDHGYILKPGPMVDDDMLIQ